MLTNPEYSHHYFIHSSDATSYNNTNDKYNLLIDELYSLKTRIERLEKDMNNIYIASNHLINAVTKLISAV